MSEIIRCPCGVLVEMPDRAAGAGLRCPQCQQTLAINSQAASPHRPVEATADRHRHSTPEAARRNHHQTMLALAMIAIVGAFLLTVRSDGRVALRMLPAAVLPPSCYSRTLFGVDCPGCGLTRSFIYLAERDLRASLEMHRLGWLMALAVLLQIPYRAMALRRPDGRPLGTRLPTATAYALIGLLIGNWLMTFIWP